MRRQDLRIPAGTGNIEPKSGTKAHFPKWHPEPWTSGTDDLRRTKGHARFLEKLENENKRKRGTIGMRYYAEGEVQV